MSNQWTWKIRNEANIKWTAYKESKISFIAHIIHLEQVSDSKFFWRSNIGNKTVTQYIEAESLSEAQAKSILGYIDSVRAEIAQMQSILDEIDETKG